MYKFTAKEDSINCHGLNFLCVYGEHINGGYVAIINWGVAAELSASKYDIDYNRINILAALERSDSSNWLPTSNEARSAIARDLAMMISDRIRDTDRSVSDGDDVLDLTEQQDIVRK